MVIERISPNSALLNVCSSFILFYASLSFASPFKAFQHCFLCKLRIVPGTAVGINLSCAASVKFPVNRADMHAECVRNIRQGCTCVVLFLLGNALSSCFDGRFFNVIITLLLLAAIGLVHHLLNVVFFSAKVISKLPIVHSLDKLLGIVVGILETVLIVWTIYAFNIFRDLGTLGQVIVDYTRDSKILTCLYENNYLAYLIEQLGQKLPFFVK